MMFTPAVVTDHVVIEGESLWAIAGQELGNPLLWPSIFSLNQAEISNPNLIYPGQRLKMPSRHAGDMLDADIYTARHASGYQPQHSSGHYSGTLSCSGLEQLWVSQGGNPAVEFVAAEVAMAESSGDEYATGPYGEKGYWQINPWAWGSLATYDPAGNARAAIIISHDGTDWHAWTTYDTGAFEGQCSA